MRVGNFDLSESILNNTNDVDSLKSIAHNNKTNSSEKLSGTQREKEADSVAKEFETLFVEMMMKSMRETAKPEDESNAQGIYRGMLDGEYSKNMTDAQSSGIREMVRNWIMENKGS